MKAVSRDQTHEVIARVVRSTRWGDLDHDALQKSVIEMSEEEFGRRFTQFLKNGANLSVKGPSAFHVDRSKSFSPAEFIGSGWTIWCGPKGGDGLTGEEAQDATSLALTEIDFAKVLFTACLKDGESVITGEEKLLRHMTAGHIRLDAKIGQCLLEEEGQATLEWLYKTFGVTWFELPGTVLRHGYGNRCFLYLYRHDNGRWDWNYYWLGNARDAGRPSAVLAK